MDFGPPARMQACLEHVHKSIANAMQAVGRTDPIRLVAVSKTKSVDAIREAFNMGQRCFGENRIDELVQKAAVLPKDIKWHFIGTIQTNKIRALLEVPNLACIETVDSLEHARKLHEALLRRHPGRKQQVFLQVNTSGEHQKHGFAPDDLLEALLTIKEDYQALQINGLMSIGALEVVHQKEGVNPDFDLLRGLRDQAQAHFPYPLELSMGMSADYELAIRMGSTNVRIGTTLFGQRGK